MSRLWIFFKYINLTYGKLPCTFGLSVLITNTKKEAYERCLDLPTGRNMIKVF